MPILDLTQPYTFEQIRELQLPADDLAQDFGYTYHRTHLNLPQSRQSLDRLRTLRADLEAILPYVELSNPTACREILFAPLAVDLVHYSQTQLRIEYPLQVTPQLQGSLSHLFYSPTQLLLIEAHQPNLYQGITQLIVELIALDQWERTPQQPILLGAATTGKTWQFISLNRSQNLISQDLVIYHIPEDLNPLMQILVSALSHPFS